MNGPTQERNHLPAPNVTSHLKKEEILRDITFKRPTQERNHLPAPNVTSQLKKEAI